MGVVSSCARISLSRGEARPCISRTTPRWKVLATPHCDVGAAVIRSSPTCPEVLFSILIRVAHTAAAVGRRIFVFGGREVLPQRASRRSFLTSTHPSFRPIPKLSPVLRLNPVFARAHRRASTRRSPSATSGPSTPKRARGSASPRTRTLPHPALAAVNRPRRGLTTRWPRTGGPCTCSAGAGRAGA